MTVYVSNLSEDVWPFIQAIGSPQAREYEIAENANLAERDLFAFAGEDNVLFLSPKSISQEFFSYYTSLFGSKNFQVVTPPVHTGEMCEDILADESCLEAIAGAANGQKRLILTSYTTSSQFLKLVRTLRERGFDVYTPESPEEEDAWTVDFFGSKSGIRQLAQQSGAKEPDFTMADGLICTGVHNAVKIAAKKYLLGNGVVVKTNKGHSGAGVLIFREGDLPTEYQACTEAILSHLKKDAYWDKFPIVIEDYININHQIAGGFPNAEFRIYKTGRIEFLYYCGMRITPMGVFQGMEIHDEVMSDRHIAQVMDTGFFIGERFAAAGYRGYYDVDFVATKNGRLIVTESNVRRTGGTHVFKTAQHLIGGDFLHDACVLSNNMYPLPKGKQFTFAEMQAFLSPVMYDKRTKEGLIVISEHMLTQGNLSYIIFGVTKKRALKIEERTTELLTKP